jgi:hypothetical protein
MGDQGPYGLPGAPRNFRLMRTGEDSIPEPECWRLLATSAIGRIALSLRALPAILPVQYYLTGRRLAVCLGHYQLPGHALDEAVIAFSADSIDPGARSGWSIQIQGRSVIPPQPGTMTACGWPTEGQIVQIEPETITGYRVHMCPFIDALIAGGSAGAPAVS